MSHVKEHASAEKRHINQHEDSHSRARHALRAAELAGISAPAARVTGADTVAGQWPLPGRYTATSATNGVPSLWADLVDLAQDFRQKRAKSLEAIFSAQTPEALSEAQNAAFQTEMNILIERSAFWADLPARLMRQY